MITARLNIHVFPGGYDYRSVEVNGTGVYRCGGAFDLYGCWATNMYIPALPALSASICFALL